MSYRSSFFYMFLKHKISPDSTDFSLKISIFCNDSRETRLTEAIDNICERILQYSVHAERPGSLRYAKVMFFCFTRSALKVMH